MVKSKKQKKTSLATWNDLSFWESDTWEELKFMITFEDDLYPEKHEIFRALLLTPLHEVKVVVLGQDPYPLEGAADGLAFSYSGKGKWPVSLINVLQELQNDLGCQWPKTGKLDTWAKQGVLLLNRYLTVQEGKPLSHKDWGWEKLTDEIVQTILAQNPDAVFIIWGEEAHKALKALDNYDEINKVVSAHPSPRSAHKGFFHSSPFSKTNNILKRLNRREIDWQLPAANPKLAG